MGEPATLELMQGVGFGILRSTSPAPFLEEKMTDPVNHPPHYTQGKIESIDCIEAGLSHDEFTGFCVGNAMKYLHRWRRKGGVEDLKKAAWYINRIIERGNKC
jgi:Protein of unknwon function (DUF3310)